jgi:prepilin signal peptidase PulO-like enzyme (type II secretory pathway)
MTLLLLILLFSAVEDIWLLSIDIRVPIAAIAITILLTFVLSHQLTGGSVASNLDQTMLLSQLASGWIGAMAVAVLIVFSRGKGLGSGDIYWFFFVGSSLGLVGLATTALLTIFTAASVGIAFAIYKRRLKGEIIPLVPFIIVSWLIAFTFQAELLATWQNLLYV